MIVQDFLFRKCRRLPSEYHLSSSLRNMNYTQKQYCDGPCWRGQQHICHGGETGV
jgi:hypothetical protein